MIILPHSFKIASEELIEDLKAKYGKPSYYPKSVWFYAPQMYFHSLSPINFGHDEYARKTVVIGWNITGQVVIAYKECDLSDEVCIQDKKMREKFITHYKESRKKNL